MEFKLRQKTINVCEAQTDNGNFISYRVIDEDKIVFLDDKNTTPTRITLHCKFKFTTPMADLMETSKIVQVEQITFKNAETSVELIPRPLFNYEAMNDLLFDLFEKFAL